MNRRDALKGIAGSVALAACWRAEEPQASPPKTEHFVPGLVTMGAAAELARTEVTFPITGFWNGMPFTKRSVQIA